MVLPVGFSPYCKTWIVDVQAGYDAVASAYAERFRDELDAKPFDTKMLDWLAERAGPVGPICDMGCGPGQVAAYLHARGCDTCGVDLSAQMVRQAERANPGVPFERGDMRTWSPSPTRPTAGSPRSTRS